MTDQQPAAGSEAWEVGNPEVGADQRGWSWSDRLPSQAGSMASRKSSRDLARRPTASGIIGFKAVGSTSPPKPEDSDFHRCS
jgi:hypothetical protein